MVMVILESFSRGFKLCTLRLQDETLATMITLNIHFVKPFIVRESHIHVLKLRSLFISRS